MTKKIVVAVLALAGALSVLCAPSALAAKAPHRYSPRHRAKCHRGYKRVVKHKRHHHTKVFCVTRAAKRHRKAVPGAVAPAPPSDVEKPKLHSHLDPTFTRDPLNPFKVTYAYSASASQEAAPQLRALGVTEEPAPLPAGVLALYSDGKLECAINVGESSTEGECPVDYEVLGQHTVTTIYSSGEQSATETEVEQIEQIPTTNTLSVVYADLENIRPIKANSHCNGRKDLDSDWELCTYEYEWEVGTLTESATSDPAGSVAVRCIGLSCPTGLTGSIDGTTQAPVILAAHGSVSGKYGEVPNSPTCEQVKAAAMSGESSLDHWTYPSRVALSASTMAAGYSGSPATVDASFTPQDPCSS